MSDQKWKPAPSYRPKGVKLPGGLEVPNLTERDLDAPEERAVTSKAADKRARPSRGASIRALAIVASIVALAVPAAPVAWAGVHEYGHVNNIVTDNKDPDKLGAVRNHGAGVIASVNVKYT